MTVYVKLELTTNLLGIDDRRYTFISFIEQCQYSLVNIVVDKDNTLLRTLNQVGHECIGIINLSVVEHSLLRLRIALIQSAKYLVYAFVRFLLMLLHFQLMVLNRFQATEHRSVGCHEMAHGDKGPHDLDIDLNGCFGTENTAKHRHTLLCKGKR